MANQIFDKKKKYKTPSGMGGSFDLRFVKEVGGEYHFRVTTKGWERTLVYTEKTVSKVVESL